MEDTDPFMKKKKHQLELDRRNVKVLVDAVKELTNKLGVLQAELVETNRAVQRNQQEIREQGAEFQDLRVQFFTMKTQLGVHRNDKR